MPSIPIGLQLYSIREDWAKDQAGTLTAVAAMGYSGVEFFGNYTSRIDGPGKVWDLGGDTARLCRVRGFAPAAGGTPRRTGDAASWIGPGGGAEAGCRNASHPCRRGRIPQEVYQEILKQPLLFRGRL